MKPQFNFQNLRVLVLWSLVLAGFDGYSNPQGMTVVTGSARAQQQGNQLQITMSQNTFLQWNSFNIAAGETTVFQQPSASSVVWNNIQDANPSAIYGSLHANGVVVLQNQSGFYFGPNSFVSAAGLVVTTTPFEPGFSGGSGVWTFDGPPVSRPIVNYGHLETKSGGSLFLISKQIENHGTIEAQGGTVGLLAGQEVLISDRPDGSGLSARVRLPEGSVDNQGRIIADAGSILLQAQNVNQSGLIQANSVREHNGTIELFASYNVQLAGTSVIEANGGAQGTSPGGSVTLQSGNTFGDASGSTISVAGGALGGAGGVVEISAPVMPAINSVIDGHANAGGPGGGLRIDPVNIILGNSGTGSAGSGTVASGSSPAALNLNVNSAFTGFSKIDLQATGNITLSDGVTWDLAASTGISTPGSQLTLEASGNILIGTSRGANLTADAGWSLTLEAGRNFSVANTVVPGVPNTAAAGTVNSGVGNITLAGSGTIQAQDGSISLLAGNGVTVGSGAIRTVGGGNISVQTLAGSVNCGSSANGFLFGTTGVGYTPAPQLGGISTAAGGNVAINSGGNVTAFLPVASTSTTLPDAGTGAFGSEPGNVTIDAAGNITGHYVLVNGTGTVQAGENAGTSSTQLALSLVKGSWSVTAGNSIDLQEVRNPNGVFNAALPVGNPFRFHFDYDPNASVTLDADNQIILSDANLPRNASDRQLTVVYPPSLTLEAGAGGILLGGNVTLFPSAVGSLDITTVSGGDLGSTILNTARYLVLSDSDKRQWTSASDFTSSDRGANIIHLNDDLPVTIDISGTMRDMNIVSSEPLQITVDGIASDLSGQPYSIFNCSLSAENLRPTDQTTITAAGPIRIRSTYTFETVPLSDAAPNISLLAQATDLTASALANEFFYIPSTRQLGFDGIMSKSQLNALLNMTVKNPDGTTTAETFVDAAIINKLYTDSNEDVPSSPVDGIQVSGPGTLTIKAASMDLGTAQGIRTTGIATAKPNPALIPCTPAGSGASINISLAGNLDMFSSSIISEYGGDVNISAGGGINIGTQEPIGASELPRGIISLWGGNINVIANGNVEVNGSRIASYDGGSIFVESQEGNVDAGKGGAGSVTVTKPYVNAQGNAASLIVAIPGSGIIATTFPVLAPGEHPPRLGNITIDTPMGDITASQGGVVQIPLGPTAPGEATINLTAGSVDSDGKVHVGNIDASDSGVIGRQVNLNATGNIEGLVVASQGVNISSRQNINVTVLAQGGVSVNAGGTVSGTIAGTGSVDVSGGDVSAALSGGSVSTGGNLSGAATASTGAGASPSAAATAAQAVQETALAGAGAAGTGDDSDETRRNKEHAQLSEYVGRVTVTPEK